CRDVETRRHLQTAQILNCGLAEHRLQSTIQECAMFKLIHESEINRIWHTLTESYYRLCGIIVPIAMYFLYLMIGGYWDERRTQNFFDTQAKFISTFNVPQQLLAKTLSPPRKRKKRNKIVIIDNNSEGDEDDYLA
ncbi:hypothetical protein OAB94_02965, partial [Flavobacteriaceae bacterium]|nr:hypothetical protein [Flavobacteriaceae bacterium]